ncbi:uncharacterized protein EI90DRAFT_3294306 [Cantharellus anzutake]|uniref:uncharacterized protein n=1 Tax=Cantharellus anzutake TaxID=1750568 RepID=UPI001903F353|nr:uncharacterized protein EI90DRAFT_3294306 [Cantharellus anzutake]KAF8314350.1 hypothetical protein EI90DRAFT_3294306 [Cantharellus anzutake]
MRRRLYLCFLLLLSPFPEVIPCRNMHHIGVLDLPSPRAPLPHVINNLDGVLLTTSSSVFNFWVYGPLLSTACHHPHLDGLRTTPLNDYLFSTVEALMIGCSNMDIGFDMGFVQVFARFQGPWIPSLYGMRILLGGSGS